MPKFVKFANKDLNPDRLRDELELAAILPEKLLFAGFHVINDRLMEPFLTIEVIATHTGQPDTTAVPGELHFGYPSDPGATLDVLLAAHDATLLSKSQTNHDADVAAIPILVSRYKNWDTLTDPQKDSVLRQLTRLVARLLDSAEDL